MVQIENQEEKKRQYSRIPIKKRMILVKQVLKKGKSLSDVIKQLNIKITTARFIINKYRESGGFPRRKFRKRQVKKISKSVVQMNKELFQKTAIKEEHIDKQPQEIKQQMKMEENYIQPYFYYYPCPPWPYHQ